MRRGDNKRFINEFALRRVRQHFAIGITLLFVLLIVALYRRPDIFGEYSKDALFGAEAIAIAAFIGFSYFNWRCPSCNKYLGNDINKYGCRHCGTRLR